MPVGLNLVETIEETLVAEGLLPDRCPDLHRVIDFSRGEFMLRWPSPEDSSETITVHLCQQLANQRSLGRPVVVWRAYLGADENGGRTGRSLIDLAQPPLGLARAVVAACSGLLGSTPGGADAAPASSNPDLPLS